MPNGAPLQGGPAPRKFNVVRRGQGRSTIIGDRLAGGIKARWQRIPPQAITAIWISLAAAVLILRIYECTLLPGTTGDLSRHIYYGLLVAERGLGVASQPLVQLDPAYRDVAWSDLPYAYPVLTLFFFTFVTWISPTLFFVRLSLTAVEAANSLLVGLTSRDRWLALLYWASPSSIWWISREGQFEALQSFFVFLGFFLLRRFPAAACVALAFAIQVKLTAVLLLPLVAWLVWTSQGRGAWRSAVAFVAGFAPTAVATLFYPAIDQLRHNAPLNFNPYFWNVFSNDMFMWMPPSMIW